MHLRVAVRAGENQGSAGAIAVHILKYRAMQRQHCGRDPAIPAETNPEKGPDTPDSRSTTDLLQGVEAVRAGRQPRQWIRADWYSV